MAKKQPPRKTAIDEHAMTMARAVRSAADTVADTFDKVHKAQDLFYSSVDHLYRTIALLRDTLDKRLQQQPAKAPPRKRR
jgi:hypothetical protein